MIDSEQLAKQIVNAYERITDKHAALDFLSAIVDSVIPEEKEAPRAQFDCPPRKMFNFGKEEKLGYNHAAYMRRQFEQEKLNFCWEQRQKTRAQMLAIIAKCVKFTKLLDSE